MNIELNDQKRMNAEEPATQPEIFAEKRQAWLADFGMTFKDVLQDDETGEEYIMVEPDLMDEGEPEDGKYRKIMIPKELYPQI